MDVSAALKRMGGDRSLLSQMAQLFLEDSPGLLDTIAAAIRAGQVTEMQRAAHSLKGLAANFDAHAAVSAASRLEAMGRNGEIHEANDALELLRREVGQLRSQLQFRFQTP